MGIHFKRLSNLFTTVPSLLQIMKATGKSSYEKA